MNPLYIIGGAALLLWPKKEAPAPYAGPEIDPKTGERDPHASAVGTFARGDVIDIGDDFEVTYIPPGRKYQP